MWDQVGNLEDHFSFAMAYMGLMTTFLESFHAVWLFLNYDLLDCPKPAILWRNVRKPIRSDINRPVQIQVARSLKFRI